MTGEYTTYAVKKGTSDTPEYVTDSAASGTGWATGHKTYNNAISVDPVTLKRVGREGSDGRPKIRRSVVSSTRRLPSPVSGSRNASASRSATRDACPTLAVICAAASRMVVSTDGVS